MQQIHSKAVFLRMIKLLNDVNEYGRRHDYAWRHSDKRTESTKDLFDEEMLAVIKEIEEEFAVVDPGAAERAACDKMRKKILSKAHDMKWELKGGKIDMARVEQWCTEQGPYKKAFNKHNAKELAILVSVFTNVYKHFMSKI